MTARPLPEIPVLAQQSAVKPVSPEIGDNRFTITDYDYPHEDELDLAHEPEAQTEVLQHVSSVSHDGFGQFRHEEGLAESSNAARGNGNQVSGGVGDGGIIRQPSLPLTKAGLRLHQSLLATQPIYISDGARESYLTPLPSLPHSTNHQQSYLATDLEAMAQKEERSWSHAEEDEDMVEEDEEEQVMPSWSEQKTKPAITPLKPTPPAAVTTWSLKKIIPASIPCRLLLLTVILETCIDLAIEGNLLWRFNQEVKSSNSTELEIENKRRLPVYLCIFGLAHLVQLVLTIDAIRTKNTIQVVGLAIFNGMFLIYAGIQISEIRNILGSSTMTDSDTGPSLLTLPLNVLTAVIIGVIAASEVVVIILTWFIWLEFGWKNYRNLGADIQIKRFYFQYQVFECVCRFTAFFLVGFGIQFIFLVLAQTDPEFIATCVAFPASLLILALGIFGAKYENKYLMSSFMLGLAAAAAYFIFKLVRIWREHATYANISTSLTVFAALSLTCVILCAGWGVAVWRNFGKGLKEHIVKPRPMHKVTSQHSSPVAEYPMQSAGMSVAQKRITIE